MLMAVRSRSGTTFFSTFFCEHDRHILSFILWIIRCVFPSSSLPLGTPLSPSVLPVVQPQLQEYGPKSKSKVCTARRCLIDCHSFGSGPIRGPPKLHNHLAQTDPWSSLLVQGITVSSSGDSSWRAGVSDRP